MTLLRTLRSRLPTFGSSGSGLGGGLDVRGEGRWDGAGVVLGVVSKGRAEYVRAVEGISVSEVICRSLSIHLVEREAP